MPTEEESSPTPPREEAGITHERKQEIIEAVNNELVQEMQRLHGSEHFHNEGHIEDVEGDALAILSIFEKYGATGEDERLVAKTAASGHDIIIEHTVQQDKTAFNAGQRMRHRGFGDQMPEPVKALVKARGGEKGNEELSWERTLEVINQKDPNKEVYTDAVREKIRLAIAATYPNAYPATLPEGATTITDPQTNESVDLTAFLGKDKDGKPMAFKFDQPFLNAEGADLSTLAVAFGDLMYGGKCDAETFIAHGNEEYRELNEVAMGELEHGGEGLSPERKAAIAKGMIGWIGTQVGFLLWQKVRFEEVLNSFKPIAEHPEAENMKADLRAAYGNFDNNLLSAKDRITRSARFGALTNPETYTKDPEAARALFADLLSDMGITQEKVVY